MSRQQYGRVTASRFAMSDTREMSHVCDRCGTRLRNKGRIGTAEDGNKLCRDCRCTGDKVWFDLVAGRATFEEAMEAS